MIITEELDIKEPVGDWIRSESFFESEQDFLPRKHCGIVNKETLKPVDIILREDISYGDAKEEIMKFLRIIRGKFSLAK